MVAEFVEREQYATLSRLMVEGVENQIELGRDKATIARKGFVHLWLAALGIALLIAVGSAVADWPTTRTYSYDWTIALVEAPLNAK